MTRQDPPDSKIAAVAKAIKEAHECYGNEYTTIACAAIEAADPALRDFTRDTPISEPNDGWAADKMGPWDARYSGSAKEIEDHTIERCIVELERLQQPQLDDHDDYARGINDALKQAADALRTLKEKPL